MLAFEQLERRTLLSATLSDLGVLEITGTRHADKITVTNNANGVNLDVSIDGQTSQFLKSSIQLISISGGRGADDIEIANDVLIPASISGGPGNDTLVGGGGNDTILGGPGDDLIIGQDGNDNLIGGAGNDTLVGGAGNDTLVGGRGNDALTDTQGSNVLLGGAGNDTLAGNAGDTLLGGGGDNTIQDTGIGSMHNDLLITGFPVLLHG